MRRRIAAIALLTSAGLASTVVIEQVPVSRGWRGADTRFTIHEQLQPATAPATAPAPAPAPVPAPEPPPEQTAAVAPPGLVPSSQPSSEPQLGHQPAAMPALPASQPAPAPASAQAARGLPTAPAGNAVEDTRRGGEAWNRAKVNRAAIPPMTKDTLSEAAVGAAEPGFKDLDCQSRDNVITIDEAATFGVENGIPWSELKTFFDVVDMNKDEKITLQEFNAALPVSQAIIEDLRPGFRDLDLDGNQLISKEEWMAYCTGWMKPKPEKAVCDKLFGIADTVEPKGSIDYSEFRTTGEKCKKTEDGNCLVLVSARSRNGLELMRKASSTSHTSGAQLFAALVRRHRRAGGVVARVAARRKAK